METDKACLDDFGGLKCSQADCQQMLFEVERDLLEYVPTAPVCGKCHGSVHAILSSFNENDFGKLVIRFWCDGCRESQDHKLPSIRKYCKGCKNYHHLFLYAFLGVPRLSKISKPLLRAG